MFDLFTKPSGKKETTKGRIIGIFAGVFVASGFYALNDALDMFSPLVATGLTLFFLIITTYEVRKRLAQRVNKYGNDGYLLPEYWQCVVCKAGKTDKRATHAVRVSVFIHAIVDERFFLDLDQTNRATVKEYISYLAHPQGALLERPPGTECLEDTSGMARDGTGWGFDAVYLCDAHAGEFKLSIETPKKRKKNNERKDVGGKPNDQKQVSPKRAKKQVERTAPKHQSVKTGQKSAASLVEEKKIQTKPYQPGQREPEEFIHYIANLLKQKSDNKLDQIVILVGFVDYEVVKEALEQVTEIDLHTDHVKMGPQFGDRNPLIELRYDDSIDQNLVEADARALKGWGATDISAVGISQETLREFQYWYGEKSCPLLVAAPLTPTPTAMPHVIKTEHP